MWCCCCTHPALSTLWHPSLALSPHACCCCAAACLATCSDLICSILDPLVEHFTNAAELGVSVQPTPQLLHQLSILEGQLAWMVSIVGAVLRGKLTSSSTESQDAIDGELAARVLALLQVGRGGVGAGRGMRVQLPNNTLTQRHAHHPGGCHAGLAALVC